MRVGVSSLVFGFRCQLFFSFVAVVLFCFFLFWRVGWMLTDQHVVRWLKDRAEGVEAKDSEAGCDRRERV